MIFKIFKSQIIILPSLSLLATLSFDNIIINKIELVCPPFNVCKQVSVSTFQILISPFEPLIIFFSEMTLMQNLHDLLLFSSILQCSNPIFLFLHYLNSLLSDGLIFDQCNKFLFHVQSMF
jgi:hypothetical protein